MSTPCSARNPGLPTSTARRRWWPPRPYRCGRRTRPPSVTSRRRRRQRQRPAQCPGRWVGRACTHGFVQHDRSDVTHDLERLIRPHQNPSAGSPRQPGIITSGSPCPARMGIRAPAPRAPRTWQGASSAVVEHQPPTVQINQLQRPAGSSITPLPRRKAFQRLEGQEDGSGRWSVRSHLHATHRRRSCQRHGRASGRYQ